MSIFRSRQGRGKQAPHPPGSFGTTLAHVQDSTTASKAASVASAATYTQVTIPQDGRSGRAQVGSKASGSASYRKPVPEAQPPKSANLTQPFQEPSYAAVGSAIRFQQEVPKIVQQGAVLPGDLDSSDPNRIWDAVPSEQQRYPPPNPLFRFISSIPHPADDDQVKDRIKQVFNHAEEFVTQFYHNEVRYDEDIPDACLDRTNRSPVFSTPELQFHLSSADFPTTLIIHELVALLLHLIAFNRIAGQRSLLPKEFQCHAVLHNAITSTAHSPFFQVQDVDAVLSAHRVLAAYVRPNVEKDTSYHQERHELIESVAATFERNFSQWSRGSRNERREEMRKLLVRTAELGVFLFSQPSTFAFNWGVTVGKPPISMVPIWPCVIREVDHKGMIANKPEVLIRHREKALVVWRTGSRQDFSGLGVGPPSSAKEPSISSDDEVYEDGSRRPSAPFDEHDKLTVPFASNNASIKRENVTKPTPGYTTRTIEGQPRRPISKNTDPDAHSASDTNSEKVANRTRSSPLKTMAGRKTVSTTQPPVQQVAKVNAQNHEHVHLQQSSSLSFQAYSHDYETNNSNGEEDSRGQAPELSDNNDTIQNPKIASYQHVRNHNADSYRSPTDGRDLVRRQIEPKLFSGTNACTQSNRRTTDEEDSRELTDQPYVKETYQAQGDSLIEPRYKISKPATGGGTRENGSRPPATTRGFASMENQQAQDALDRRGREEASDGHAQARRKSQSRSRKPRYPDSMAEVQERATFRRY